MKQIKTKYLIYPIYGIRFLVMMIYWYFARTSYVYVFRTGNMNDNAGLLFDASIFVLKILIVFGVEYAAISFDDINSTEKGNSLFLIYGILMLLAELLLLVTILIDLERQQSMEFILAVISSASAGWILISPSEFNLIWIVLILIGISVTYTLLQIQRQFDEDDLQSSTIILMLRFILLPI